MKTYNQFVNESQINEGLFDMFKKMFNKIGQYINKVKGGKEIEAIYKKYIDLINKEFQKQGITELNIGDTTVPTSTVPTTTTTTKPTTPTVESLKLISRYQDFLNEELDSEAAALSKDESEKENTTANGMTVAKLKQKTVVLKQIIEKYKQIALKEMNAIVKKYGGDEKNPKLRLIANNKMDQFDLDYLNAEVAFLEKSGDKSMINQVKADRDKLSKDLNAKWSNFDEAGNVAEGGALAMGTYYAYKTPTGIKTIKTVQASPNQGKVTATYVYDKDGQIKNQDFAINNIVTELDFENGKKYNYYSETNNDVIPVTVKEYDKANKTIVLISEKGNEFNGNVGSMRDEITEAPPVEGTAPAVAPAVV